MNCKNCDRPLGYRQRMFCSIGCRNSANGKKTGGWNKNQQTVLCQNCEGPFQVPLHRLKTAIACSRKCLGEIQSRERTGTFCVGPDNPMWKDGRSPYSYRRFLKPHCERCGKNEKLLIHHKDRNRLNQTPSNLETLCFSCHHMELDMWTHLPSLRPFAAKA